MKILEKRICEMCAKFVTEKVINNSTKHEMFENVNNVKYLGNKHFYIKAETSLIDFSTTFSMFIEEICIDTEIIQQDEVFDIEEMMKILWKDYVMSFYLELTNEVISLNEDYDGDGDFKRFIKWSKVVRGAYYYMKNHGSSEDEINKMYAVYEDVLFIEFNEAVNLTFKF